MPGEIIKSASIDIPDVSVTKFLFDHVDKFGDKPCLIDGPSDRAIKYSQLKPMIRAAATGLSKAGLKKGDVFAILSPNLPEYAIAFNAVAIQGAIVTTMNPLYTADEIAHQLKDSKATMLLTVGLFVDKVKEAVTKGAPITKIYQFDAKEVVEGDVPVIPFASLLAGGDDGFPEVEVKGDDVLAIPYSSGTSGLPKGVELTHKNVVANIVQVMGDKEQMELKEDDKLIGVLPFFHIYGLVIILNVGLAAGVTTITMPKFDPALFLKLLKVHGITVAHVAPPLVNFLAKHPAVENVLPLPQLRELFSGAAPLGAELVTAAKKRLGLDYVRQGYGMTEMSPASHVQKYSDTKPGSIGHLVPGMECKVISTETGEIVGPNEKGEICCKGPNIMKGYLNKPEATADTIDADGFLHTGDVGYMDDEGSFFIVDRVKELIKVKGFQVAPAELEALIAGNEKVADVAVIGVEDERAGELPKAFVVKQAGQEITEDEVKEFVKGKVADYKQLAVVEFVETIPKSAAGKILRKVLRAQEKAKVQEKEKVEDQVTKLHKV